MLKKLLLQIRCHYRVSIALAAAVLLTLCIVGLSAKASKESTARKTPEALQFETAPDNWLTHQSDVAEFRRALDGGTLSAVGVARTEPGLVLYTLKNGRKASTVVPGCTLLGCAGTALDSLDEKSAKAGFSLVRVDVDPRTASRRVLDVLTNLLSPLLVIATLVGILFFSMKMQSGMGGSSSIRKRPLRTPSVKKRQRPR